MSDTPECTCEDLRVRTYDDRCPKHGTASSPAANPPGKLTPRFLAEWERLDWEREQRGETPLGPLGTGAPAKPPGDLVAALARIRDECGKVCSEYETCSHIACQSSHVAWEIAAEALRQYAALPPGNLAAEEAMIAAPAASGEGEAS